MQRTMWILLFVLLFCSTVITTPVHAAGGFFGREAPSEPLTSSNNDAIVFGVVGNTVTLEVQLQLQLSFSNGNDWSWILPLPVAPTKIERGSSVLLEALYNATRPRFELVVNEQGGGELVEQQQPSQQPSQTTATTTATSRQGPSEAIFFPGYTFNTRPPSRDSRFVTCSADALNLSCAQQIQGADDGMPSRGPGSGGGFDLGFGTTPEEEPDDQAIVMEQGTVGILDYVVLDGTTADVVLDWLSDNGYSYQVNTDNNNETSTTREALEHYVERGYVFVAVKLELEDSNATTTTTSTLDHPLRIQYELSPNNDNNGDNVLYSVPLHMGRHSNNNNNNMTWQVYFLTQAAQADTASSRRRRAMSVNYLDVSLEDAHVDWVGCLNSNEGEMEDCYQQDYMERFQAVVKEHDNSNGMLLLSTEYAGPTSNLALEGILGGDYYNFETMEANLTAATTWLEFLTHLETAGVPDTDETLQNILLQYIPLSFAIEFPFQCRQWEQIYHPNPQYTPTMEDCYALYQPPSPEWVFDAQGLYHDLYEQVFGPAQQAQEWLHQFLGSGKGGYLTRFLGYIPSSSISTFTSPLPLQDPYFVIRNAKDVDDISHIHIATAVPVCDEYDTPTSLEITIGGNSTITTTTNGTEDDTSNSNGGEGESVSVSRTKSGFSLTTERETVVFWQPATLTCPTWEKTSSDPVFYQQDAALARTFRLHSLDDNEDYGIVLYGNNATEQDFEAALAHGRERLAYLMSVQTNNNDLVVEEEDPQFEITINGNDENIGGEDNNRSTEELSDHQEEGDEEDNGYIRSSGGKRLTYASIAWGSTAVLLRSFWVLLLL